MPDKTGTADERPNADQPNAAVPAVERATWAMWRADGSPTGTAKRDPYRKLARALDADGLLGPWDELRAIVDDLVTTGKARIERLECELETSNKIRAAHVAEIRRVAAERDEDRAKLAKVRELLDAWGLRGEYHTNADREFYRQLRTIVDPEATRG